MSKRSLANFTITVDSKEKTPWKFPQTTIKVASLQKYGCDYAISGQLGIIGVERKSYSDYVRCLGKGWNGFIKQIEKLQSNQIYCLIVEGNLTDKIPRQSKMNHMAIMEQTTKLLVAGVPVLFAGKPSSAAKMCYKFFYQALRRIRYEQKELFDD